MTKRALIIAIAALCLALSGPALGPSTAHAQEADDDRDYVDVGLTLEVPPDHKSETQHFMNVIVVNNGTRTAYDVEVVVDVVSPDQSRMAIDGRAEVQAPVGHLSLDGTALVWTIPELGALQREVLTPLVAHERVAAPAYDNGLDPHEIFGTVTTASFESDRHKANNTSRVWSFEFSTRNRWWIQAAVDYSVNVSVDRPQPSPGDTVNFTVTADRDNLHTRRSAPLGSNRPPPIDLKVDIELTGGLSHTGTPTYYSSRLGGNPRSPLASAIFQNDVFTIGTGKADDGTDSDSVTLPVTVASDAVVNEQCLTARLTGNPPPGNGPLDDDIANNVMKLCLGAPPVEPIVSGEVDIFTVYDCFARRTHPCDGTDGVRVRAVNKNIDAPVVMAPGTTIIQVQDPIARVYDSFVRRSAQQSVTDANTVSWQTASTDEHRDFTGITRGVKIFFSRIPFNGELNNWVKVAGEHVTVKGLNGGDPPGDMYIRATTTGGAITRMRSGNSWTVTYGGTSSNTDQTEPSLWLLEFSKLGTYVLEYTTIGNRDGTNGDCAAKYLPTGVAGAYCDTETYIFHVGPMADLEVRDGGASPYVAADRNALTIVAVNNGPDSAGSAQVTGLPTGADVIHVSHGTYSSTTGVWDIGELGPGGYYRSRGEPEPTLVLSASPGDTASVSIANSENYEVCVGPKSNPGNLAHTTRAACEAVTNASWNSTPVYDYNPGNNTAAIRARAGIAEVHPEAIISLRVIETPVVNILLWQRVERVSGLTVTHYEVQRWASPWATLASHFTVTAYLDWDGRAGADYRVRAVNSAGVPGPWSITGRPPDMPGNFSVALSESGNAALLTWTEPASPSPITGYVIDIADSADGDSRTNDRTVGGDVTTWTHTGLSGGGDIKFYRVHARNRDGVGLWTAWKSVGTGPGAPGSLRARASGQSEIVLTWTAASSRDTGISQYELDYSDFSRAEGYRWNALTVVYPYEGLRYVDEGLAPGTTRYYRVRAYTAADQPSPGAWSNVASATTSEAGPAPPLNLSAEADGENRIRLTWDASTGTISYNIEHSTDGETWEPERTRHTGTCSVGGQTVPCYTDSGLLSGTTHHYRVAGVNRSGAAGDWSASVSATTAGDITEPPGEPENLRITGVSGRQVSLAWDAPQNDGGSRVTGYEYMVEAACAHDPGYICQVVKPTRTGGTSATVTAPNVRGRYEFSVRALNAAGAGWWTQPVGQYIDPQRTWRVTLSPSSLRVDEGGEATYLVRLSSDPGRPVMLALWWDGDPDLGNTLSYQQFKWLLPSNYASRNPDIFVDPHWSSPWNTGVTITVTAEEDADSENGTLEIHNDVYYVPCADLGNPSGCVDDPEDTGITAYLTVTERDND